MDRALEEYAMDAGAALGLVALSAVESGDEDERARVSIAIERMAAAFRVLAEHAKKMGRPDLVEFFGGGAESVGPLEQLAKDMMENDAADIIRHGLRRIDSPLASAEGTNA